MKYIFIYLIYFYQIALSPVIKSLLGVKSVCRYPLTCSEYAKQCFEREGVLNGFILSTKRLLSCQPFGKIRQ